MKKSDINIAANGTMIEKVRSFLIKGRKIILKKNNNFEVVHFFILIQLYPDEKNYERSPFI